MTRFSSIYLLNITNICSWNYIALSIVLLIFKATLYFKREHFKTGIAVATTAMLVMYTLNSSISSKLPRTSIIKFIDVWITYGLCIHFLILILLVVIEHLPETGKVGHLKVSTVRYEQPNGQEIPLSRRDVTEIFARKTLPSIQTIFVTCYIISALIIYNK